MKFAVSVSSSAISLADSFGGSAAEVGQMDAAGQHVDFRASLAPLHGKSGSEHIQSSAFGRDLQWVFFGLRLRRDDQQAIDQADLIPFSSAEDDVTVAEDREPSVRSMTATKSVDRTKATSRERFVRPRVVVFRL